MLRTIISLLERKEKEGTANKTKIPIEDKGVNLLIIRDTFTDKSTLGKLQVNKSWPSSLSIQIILYLSL